MTTSVVVVPHQRKTGIEGIGGGGRGYAERKGLLGEYCTAATFYS